MEALKLLRVVEAKLNPEEFNTVQFPYCGMANMPLLSPVCNTHVVQLDL